MYFFHISEDHPCPLSMNHRHNIESIYDSPECTADLAEFALSIVLNLIHHFAVNGALLTSTIFYTHWRSENQWEMAIILQLISSCFHPFLEFVFSAKVRFFFKDRVDAFKGENVPSNTVFVA